jgi:hypothetical protein
MKIHKLTASLAWLALADVSPMVSARAPTVETMVVTTNVCSVLKAPETFVNQVIRLRGFVYLGEDHMNISDSACPGRGIELAITSDRVLKQRDVHRFHTQMSHQERKGIATITGLLRSNPSPRAPYVLNIQHVTDVAQREAVSTPGPKRTDALSRGGTMHLQVRTGGAIPSGFCGGATFVSLDKMLSTPSDYFDKRVQTHAVLTTNVKEYTRIWLDEKSDFSVLTTLDDESSVYAQAQHSSGPPFPAVVVDLFDKLSAVQGPKFKRDMSKLEYYRRDVMVCGRLIGSGRDLRFAVDDMHAEDSYLLPWSEEQAEK